MSATDKILLACCWLVGFGLSYLMGYVDAKHKWGPK